MRRHSRSIRPPDFRLDWRFVSAEDFVAYDGNGHREVIGEYRWHINERTGAMGYELWQTGGKDALCICWEMRGDDGRGDPVHHFAYYGTQWNVVRIGHPMPTAEIKKWAGGRCEQLNLAFTLPNGAEEIIKYQLY